LDEAQNIKNHESQRYKHLLKYQCQHRILLTGTPLQNNLQELWSLLQFLMPDLFQNYPNVTVEDKNPKNVTRNIERVRTILSPFFLRRLKSEVSQHLPKKEMKILYCDMAENQQKCYHECIKSSRKYWNMDNADLSKVVSPTSASKLRGDQDDEDIDQLIDEDFAPVQVCFGTS